MVWVEPEEWVEMAAGFYHDIPRIYTAIAEWGACMVYVLLLKRKLGRLKEGITALLFLAVQSILLVCTENVPIYLWIPVMGIAAISMYTMISLVCEGNRNKRLYCTACAFLLSEFAASFEWIIYFHFRYARGIESVLLEYGLLVGIYATLFAGVWFIERSLLNRGQDLYIAREEVKIVGMIVLTIFLFSNLSYVYPDTPFSSWSFYDSFKLRAFIDLLGVTVVFIFQLHIRERTLLEESYAINAALRSQYDQYIHHQESMEMVNMKYHDLKHQITALRLETDEEKRKQWLDSMEKELDIYKNIVNSGNTVLDILLESKLMRAAKHHIEVTYVVNGKLLEFMHVTDVCTIFGNALDNAIEAEVLESDEEKRMIHVSVSSQRQFVFIKIENYRSSPVAMSRGLPKTTKSDKRNHGYGLKSIRYCAEKYKGNMTISMEQSWFVLNVMIPRQE